MREQDASNAPEKAEKMYPVNFVAEEIPTKTVFSDPQNVGGETQYPTLWTENDEGVAVSLNFGGAKKATVTPSADFTTATFSADFAQSEVEQPYVFYALSPFTASVGATSSHGGYHLNIPTDQTPLASSCDEAAQLLIASKEVESVADFGEVRFHFSHVTAYGKLTLKNMTAIPEGATIQSIELTASEHLAGRFYYNFEEAGLSESASSRTLTLKSDNITVDASGNSGDIWFACAPADLGGGTLKVDVYTSMGILSRTVEIPTGKLAFNAGRVSKFTVNMASAEFTQAADITNSATAGAAYAMSTTQNNNNRGQAAVTVASDGSDIILQNPSSTVEVLTLVPGYYSGYFYLQETTTAQGRYIGTTSSTSNNYLRSSAASTASNRTNRGYYNWAFNISKSIAYITAYQTVSSNSGNYKHIRYNNSDSIFSAYKGTSRTACSSQQNVYIYRKVAGVNIDDDPILEQDIYGAYLSSGNKLYGAGSQLSREYINDGMVTFAILTPSTSEIAEFNGIPVDPAKGDTFTLNYNVIRGRNASDTDYNVTVVKVDGPKVWLSAGSGNGFIVKK